MYIEGICLLKKQSEHVYRVEKDYPPEIAAKGILLAIKSELPPYWSINKNYVYKDYLSDEEALEIAQSISKKTLKFKIGDEYTRETLIQLLNSKSNTKKSELLERAVQKENVLLFKDIIKSFCYKLSDLMNHHIYKAVSMKLGEDILLVIASSSSSSQYWVINNSWGSKLREINTAVSHTRFERDKVFINTKNLDGLLPALKQIEKAGVEYLRLEPCLLYCDMKSFTEKFSETEIRYCNSIEEIMAHFGVPRKASKFETFWEGLRKRSDEALIKAYLGRKIIFSDEPMLIGESKDEHFFEALASHLKLEYSQEDSLVARVVENETEETFTAVWNNWIEGNCRFYMSLI